MRLKQQITMEYFNNETEELQPTLEDFNETKELQPKLEFPQQCCKNYYPSLNLTKYEGSS